MNEHPHQLTPHHPSNLRLSQLQAIKGYVHQKKKLPTDRAGNKPGTWLDKVEATPNNGSVANHPNQRTNMPRKMFTTLSSSLNRLTYNIRHTVLTETGRARGLNRPTRRPVSCQL